MRILFISNFYPPLELGGWEQLTQEIADRLAARGHDTAVLTSRHRASEIIAPEAGVARLLHLESEDFQRYHPASFFNRQKVERANGQILKKVAKAFRPQVIFIHSMWNLPRSLAWQAEQLLPGRIVYYMASYWPSLPGFHEAYWQSSTRRPVFAGVKRVAAALPAASLRRQRERQRLQFEHVLCVSNFLREDLVKQQAIPPHRSRVLYNGIDTQGFSPLNGWDPMQWKNGAPRLLYSGSLLPHKGVHTAIEGFRLAKDLPSLRGASLTIVGGGNAAYEAGLKQLVIQGGLEGQVHFHGRVQRQQMPGLLRSFDILIFPTPTNEPLARAMMEAMACGLAVVGTTTGGSQELLVEGETGLTFEPEDAAGLARQLDRIAGDAPLRARLAKAGKQAVVERHNIEQMCSEIEIYLERCVVGEGGAG